jgi:hypothetical protein
MENKLSKAELLSGMRFVQTTELDSHVAPKTEYGAPTEIKEESRQSGSLDGIAIARAELARRRRKLGPLTRGQEVAIENLLLTTVNKISEIVGRALADDTSQSVRLMSAEVLQKETPKPAETNIEESMRGNLGAPMSTCAFERESNALANN